jgi:alpha-beta hydrolase superfamily lysophospholipase
MVQFIESERASAKGQKVAGVAFLPDAAAGPPVALLVFHHGIGEHVGRYKTSEIFGCWMD